MRSLLPLTLALALTPATAGADGQTILDLRDPDGTPLAGWTVVLECPDREPQFLETNGRGRLTLDGKPKLDGCQVTAVHESRSLRTVLGEVDGKAELVLRPFETKRVITVKPRPVETTTATGRTVSMEEFRNIPVGSATSRDFTAVVESSATASTDSAGISIAGTTGVESTVLLPKASRVRRRGRGRRAARRHRIAEATPSAVTPERRPTYRQSQLQAGLLTAAAVDDVDNPDAFRRYLATVTHPAKERFAGRHKVLQVVDPLGRPVAGAVVRAGDKNYRTRRDGRVVLIPGFDPVGGEGQTALVPRQGKQALQSTVFADITQIVLDKPVEPPTPRVDLALVVDTTGSMSDELAYLQVELGAVLEALEESYGNLDIRWGLVVYRDDQDEYVAERHDFTSDFDAFARELASESASGGGDFAEAVHVAFREANALSWRDAAEAGRVLVHVADAPPHEQHIDTAFDEMDHLRRDGTAIYPVAASGTDATSEFTMRTSALMSGGQYVFLTDHSGIGGAHREATEACYRVDTLLNVLTKILRAEIEGRRADLPIGPDGTGCGQQQ